uniref:Uncharacterized protein n=1 Tax=Romanomermis culicivorax TaxID=13658 RepID=A0A915JVK4_ROMCU
MSQNSSQNSEKAQKAFMLLKKNRQLTKSMHKPGKINAYRYSTSVTPKTKNNPHFESSAPPKFFDVDDELSSKLVVCSPLDVKLLKFFGVVGAEYELVFDDGPAIDEPVVKARETGKNINVVFLPFSNDEVIGASRLLLGKIRRLVLFLIENSFKSADLKTFVDDEIIDAAAASAEQFFLLFVNVALFNNFGDDLIIRPKALDSTFPIVEFEIVKIDKLASKNALFSIVLIFDP